MKRKILVTLFVIVALFAPLAVAPAAQAAAPGAGMIDVWVFVDADQNGIYSTGDTGLSDALACITYGSKWSSCVGTDYGDTWWEDLQAGRYVAQVNSNTVAGYQLSSIRCEETGSRVEFTGCRYNLGDWKTTIKLGKTTRINVFYGLAAP